MEHDELAFFQAVARSDIAQMETLFSNQILERVNEQERTPLLVAASRKKTHAAVWLLAHGADPGARTKTGKTVLHYAAQQGDAELIRAVTSHPAYAMEGENWNAPDRQGNTPLRLAVQAGHLDAAGALCEAGTVTARIHYDGKSRKIAGWEFTNTALCDALEKRDIPMVTLLLNNGAFPPAGLQLGEKERAVYHACGFEKIAEALPLLQKAHLISIVRGTGPSVPTLPDEYFFQAQAAVRQGFKTALWHSITAFRNNRGDAKECLRQWLPMADARMVSEVLTNLCAEKPKHDMEHIDFFLRMLTEQKKEPGEVLRKEYYFGRDKAPQTVLAEVQRQSFALMAHFYDKLVEFEDEYGPASFAVKYPRQRVRNHAESYAKLVLLLGLQGAVLDPIKPEKTCAVLTDAAIGLSYDPEKRLTEPVAEAFDLLCHKLIEQGVFKASEIPNRSRGKPEALKALAGFGSVLFHADQVVKALGIAELDAPTETSPLFEKLLTNSDRNWQEVGLKHAQIELADIHDLPDTVREITQYAVLPEVMRRLTATEAASITRPQVDALIHSLMAAVAVELATGKDSEGLIDASLVWHARRDGIIERVREDVELTGEWASLVNNKTTFVPPHVIAKGVKVENLVTAQELLWEGKKMDHCVSGYTDKCMNMQSHIFSIRRQDKPSCTIEISGSYPYTITQQRGYHNTEPSDEDRRIAHWLLEKVNKPNLEYGEKKNDNDILPVTQLSYRTGLIFAHDGGEADRCKANRAYEAFKDHSLRINRRSAVLPNSLKQISAEELLDKTSIGEAARTALAALNITLPYAQPVRTSEGLRR